MCYFPITFFLVKIHLNVVLRGYRKSTLLRILTPVSTRYLVPGSTTFRRGRSGAGRLGAADYAPGLLGAWTFMRLDFYAPRLLGARGKKFFFQIFQQFFEKKFFQKNFFFPKKVFFSRKRSFFTKTSFFPKKHFFLQKTFFFPKFFFLSNDSLFSNKNFFQHFD